MGFLPASSFVNQSTKIKGIAIATLHHLECRACPLNNADVVHPKMEATGSTKPLVYIIGEGPGAEEDREGVQFVGRTGKVLRFRIPKKWLKHIRWNNCIRTRPPDNRIPSPIEIECFPAGTRLLPIGRIKTLYRRWYDGPLTTVKTASGRILSGTPNHPVFTTSGKTPLKEIKVGDNLLCASELNSMWSRFTVGNPNRDNKPPMIDEIFDSFLKVGKVERMRTSAFDFHGDGVADAQVDVVRTNCLLWYNLRSVFEKIGKHLLKFIFTSTNATTCSLMSDSSFDTDAGVLVVVTSGPSFGSRVRSIPSVYPFRTTSKFNGVVLEYLNDATRRYSKRVSDTFCTFFCLVSTDYFKRWQRAPFAAGPPAICSSYRTFFTRSSEFYTRFTKILFDSMTIRASKFVKFCNGSVSQVEFDQVVSVEFVREFRGHVYNLETESHKYIANGIQVSNCCRPSIERDIEKTKPKAIFGFGNIPLEWAIGQTRITKWNGRKIPVRIGEHTCWFFPMLHPSYVSRSRRFIPKDVGEFGSSIEHVFALNLDSAFLQVKSLPTPIVHSVEDALEGKSVYITGSGGQNDLEKLDQELAWFAKQPVVGLDYETNNLRPYTTGAKILTAALSTGRRSLAFAIDHREAKWGRKLLTSVESLWKSFLLTADCRKVSHFLAFELEWSGFFYGREVLRAGKWGDTISQAYVLDERKGRGQPGCHSLEFLCIQHFRVNIKAIDNLDRRYLDKAELMKVLRYNRLDAKYHYLLYLHQKSLLKEEHLTKVYQEALRRVPTMVLTQLKGVPIHQPTVRKFHDKYRCRLKKLDSKIHSLKVIRRFEKQEGRLFRPSANDDVAIVLRDYLGVKRTGEGSFKTDESVLSQVDHPIAPLMLEWRTVSKLKSTYVDPLMDGSPIVFSDGLIHPIISTTRTRTWRTSSEDPNSQNFPKRKNKEVRSQIRPRRGQKVVAFDYGQIQARNIAMESKDKNLVKAFWDRYDIHRDWMERIVRAYPKWMPGGVKGLRNSKLSSKYRDRVKNEWVFPSFFGAVPKSTAGYLGIPENIAEELAEEFWNMFPGVLSWHERTIDDYYEKGYVTGLSGFRRRAPITRNEIINCVDLETECLGERGWVKANELAVGDKIYTKNPQTGDLELLPVLQLNRGQYSGPVHVMQGRMSSVSTPNHMWLVDGFIDHGKLNGGVEKVIKLVSSSELPGKNNPGHFRIHLVANTISTGGSGSWSDDEVRLVGWVLTDGCYLTYKLRRTGSFRKILCVVQSPTANADKVRMIDELMQRLDMNPQKGIKKPLRTYYYGFGCKRWEVLTTLAERIVDELPDKILTPKFLVQLSTNQLQILFDTMLLGDGCWEVKSGRYRSYLASSKAKVDSFSMLCVLLGKAHRIRFRTFKQSGRQYKSMGNIPKSSSIWMVILKQRTRIHPGYCSCWKEYTGEVWCPTTRNGTFIARRDGVVYVTGNSPIQGDEALIVCDAMSRLSELGEDQYQASLEIHDDLTFIWDDRRVEEYSEVVLDTMLRVPFPWVNVPITVDVAIGDAWDPLENIGSFSSDRWKV
mgnify:CR=1 FL=1